MIFFPIREFTDGFEAVTLLGQGLLDSPERSILLRFSFFIAIPLVLVKIRHYTFYCSTVIVRVGSAGICPRDSLSHIKLSHRS